MHAADEAMYVAKLRTLRSARLLVGEPGTADQDRRGTAVRRLDFEVITAHNGEEIISRATLERPDLIVLDYTLPDLFGTDVARRLRQAPSTTLIPIILVGKESDGSSEVDSLNSGVDDYMLKPFYRRSSTCPDRQPDEEDLAQLARDVWDLRS